MGRFEFFTTEEGYMGIGPWGSGKKDILCVLDGCPMPLAIRRTSDTNVRVELILIGADIYEVVSSCYAFGGMSGELAEDGSSGLLVFE